MVYQKHENADVLVGLTDADWGGDQNDRKSVSDYVFKAFGNVISWASRKQATVSQSSTEADEVANGIVQIKYKPKTEQTADIMTRVLEGFYLSNTEMI